MDALSREKFDELLKTLKLPCQEDRDFLYRCYQDGLESILDLKEDNPVLSSFPINHVQLILYLVNEHAFYVAFRTPEEKKKIMAEEKYEQTILSLAIDKYYTNEHLEWQNGAMSIRYLPEISTISLYLNFILGMMNRYPQGNPQHTLLTDILKKGFTMAKCIVSLLMGGFETEAFSTWRTLHENECILHVLIHYNDAVIDKYLTHLHYAVAFRGGLSKEETDKTFAKIKEEMRGYGLKSKDLKRYIEYGWLLAIPDVEKIEGFKLNFRDGVERVAGLRRYSKVYEMSSEIAHSSPLLIYSRKNYFYLVTILNLHESFFRLEKFFSSLYLNSVPEEEKKKYLAMRNLYNGELLAVYEFEKRRLAALTSQKKKDED